MQSSLTVVFTVSAAYRFYLNSCHNIVWWNIMCSTVLPCRWICCPLTVCCLPCCCLEACQCILLNLFKLYRQENIDFGFGKIWQMTWFWINRNNLPDTSLWKVASHSPHVVLTCCRMLIFLPFWCVCSWQMNTHVIISKNMCYRTMSDDYLFLCIFFALTSSSTTISEATEMNKIQQSKNLV